MDTYDRASRRRTNGASGVGSARYCNALQGLVGASAAIERVRARIGAIARSHVPVLILGETGTGKELCARAIATLSERLPFIAVNCAAIPESLVESELFGHERGAFSGAIQQHSGLIEVVDGGVLFLDELAEVPGPVQAKLLRTLDSGEFRRVGSTADRRSEFRILAATSGDVDGSIAAGHLRADLLYRVSAARITMPPLRERLEDIPLLVSEFLRWYAAKAGGAALAIAPEACAVLMQEEWPGNVRQLRNAVEVAAAYAAAGSVIEVVHVLQAVPSSEVRPRTTAMRSLAEVRCHAERRAILEALQFTGGHRERAARLLGISPATLYRKLGGQP